MVSSPLLLPRNPSSNGLTSNPNFLSLKLSPSFYPRELVYALVICVCLAFLISVLWFYLLCSVKGENSTSFNLRILSVMLRVLSLQFVFSSSWALIYQRNTMQFGFLFGFWENGGKRKEAKKLSVYTYIRENDLSERFFELARFSGAGCLVSVKEFCSWRQNFC